VDFGLEAVVTIPVEADLTGNAEPGTRGSWGRRDAWVVAREVVAAGNCENQ